MERRAVATVLALALAALPLAPGSRVGRAASSVPTKTATHCPADPAERVALGAKVRQLITVIAPNGASRTATLERWQRHRACFVAASGTASAELGRNGLSAHHHEGDGTTPIGVFGFGRVMYGALADPGVAYAWHRLRCGDWWDEDPSSPHYNRFVELACGARPPFGGDSEALWTELPAYDAFAVIAYNTDPVVPGRGSAIFLHVSTGAATNGCVALARASLLRTLAWLRPGADPKIAIAPAADFAGPRPFS
ncbi:MAG: hypothetical protein M0004_10830 [Actinomycetota bacterium]|nr:hypothetical protein [Actinomycetota bacterium]